MGGICQFNLQVRRSGLFLKKVLSGFHKIKIVHPRNGNHLTMELVNLIGIGQCTTQDQAVHLMSQCISQRHSCTSRKACYENSFPYRIFHAYIFDKCLYGSIRILITVFYQVGSNEYCRIQVGSLFEFLQCEFATPMRVNNHK